MKQIMTTPDIDRSEAIAWLAGALRWEQVLDDLRDEPAVEARPVLVDPEVRDDQGPRRAEAA